MFEEEALNKLIQRTLEATPIPDGHNAALITVVNKEGAKVVFALRKDNGWQLDTYFHSDYRGDMNYGVNVSKSW